MERYSEEDIKNAIMQVNAIYEFTNNKAKYAKIAKWVLEKQVKKLCDGILCPNCNIGYHTLYNGNDGFILKFKYCIECGQALKEGD